MITITPHEMLSLLGLEVPQAGITINPNDTFLYSQFLHMLGRRMTVDAIPADELAELGIGMEGALGKDATLWTDDKLDKLRTSLRMIQRKDLGMNVA